MKISAKAEYACLALMALARSGVGGETAPLRIREIAESHSIPERYLVQILLQLKGSGLVTSVRGATGGYRLTRPASEVTVGEVLDAIDGPVSVTEPESADPAVRALGRVWREAHLAERGVLERTTIARLVELSAPREWVI